MSDSQQIFKATNVLESNHGLNEVSDLVSIFSLNVKLPSEMVGSNKSLTKKEIAENHPHYKEYMETLKNFSYYLKNHSMDVSADAYRGRAHNIEPIKKLIEITSKLQFTKAFDEYFSQFFSQNINWNFVNIVPNYKNGLLVDTKVFIGNEEVSERLPIRVQCIDWYGNLVEEYELDNINPMRRKYSEITNNPDGSLIIDPITGKPKTKAKGADPIILGFRVAKDSLGNTIIHQEARDKHGELNVGDIRKSMIKSVLEFPIVRIVNDDEDVNVYGLETPLFMEMDYCHDIEFSEHLSTLVKYNQLVEEGRFNNLREFSLLNLFRWGILSLPQWKRGMNIFNAVMNAPLIKDSDQTIIDGKLVAWGNACIQEIIKKNPKLPDNAIDNIVIAGASISKLVSVISQSVFIFRALVVTDIEKDDLGFREARIAVRSKGEVTKRFFTMKRLNTDIYDIVELDKDDNMIGVIDAIDVMAIINYDVNAQVVSFDDKSYADKKYVEMYHNISSYCRLNGKKPA